MEKVKHTNKDLINFVAGQEVDVFTFINRIHVLEGIIFELKETLKHYAHWEHGAGTLRAKKVLEKYNKSWDDLYDECDQKLKKELVETKIEFKKKPE